MTKPKDTKAGTIYIITKEHLDKCLAQYDTYPNASSKSNKFMGELAEIICKEEVLNNKSYHDFNAHQNLNWQNSRRNEGSNVLIGRQSSIKGMFSLRLMSRRIISKLFFNFDLFHEPSNTFIDVKFIGKDQEKERTNLQGEIDSHERKKKRDILTHNQDIYSEFKNNRKLMKSSETESERNKYQKLLEKNAKELYSLVLLNLNCYYAFFTLIYDSNFTEEEFYRVMKDSAKRGPTTEMMKMLEGKQMKFLNIKRSAKLSLTRCHETMRKLFPGVMEVMEAREQTAKKKGDVARMYEIKMLKESILS